jgi:ubiquinone/menaquinone biosynthesis C-methylase UbiE
MSDTEEMDAVAARVNREKAAHEDGHIDDALRKWWAAFPHAFSNPATKSSEAYYVRELGSVKDKIILDYGCGQGDFAVWLVEQQGARVVGIDISEFNVEHCKQKASDRKLDPSKYQFLAMNAHETTFPDAYFDRVVGNGILHHLDLQKSLSEVDRILKPSGKAIFQEPLGENPLLKFYRRVAGIHTPDERPLTSADLDYLTNQWRIKVRYNGLVTFPVALVTSVLMRPYPNNFLLRLAGNIEQHLNNRHFLDHWNRSAVLVYEAGSRPSSSGI